MMWASRVSSVGLQFVVPAAIGAGVDHYWNTRPVGVVIGAILGMVTGFLSVLKLAKDLSQASKPRQDQ